MIDLVCPRCGGDGVIRCEDPECAICANDTYCEKCVECNCCNCGTLPLRHPFAVPGCEFHDHHCESCHTAQRCTQAGCKAAFVLQVQLREQEQRTAFYRTLLFQVDAALSRGDYREAIAYLERVDQYEER